MEGSARARSQAVAQRRSKELPAESKHHVLLDSQLADDAANAPCTMDCLDVRRSYVGTELSFVDVETQMEREA